MASIQDAQAIRSVDIHPSGQYFAVGSNSKVLRICAYPYLDSVTTATKPSPAKILFKKERHHIGTIYCIGWSPNGQLIATGSNDKLVKVILLDMDQPDEIHISQ